LNSDPSVSLNLLNSLGITKRIDFYIPQCLGYLVSTLPDRSDPQPDIPHSASVDLDECISRLYNKELLAESVIEAVCAKTKELLMRESNVVHVRAPITVVGDIHGQFFDLIEIFRIGGYCPDTNYLFLGNRSRARDE
jgi:hypothetical protein